MIVVVRVGTCRRIPFCMSGKEIEELVREKIEVGERLVVITDEKSKLMEDLSKMKTIYDRSVAELADVKRDYEILGERFDASEKELESLRWKLEVAPTRDIIIEEFQSSTTMREMLERAKIEAIAEYNVGEDHANEVDKAVKLFSKSPEFQRVVGERTKQMIPYLVECCREYLRDDPHRSREGFEGFFVDWKRRLSAEKLKKRVDSRVESSA